MKIAVEGLQKSGWIGPIFCVGLIVMSHATGCSFSGDSTSKSVGDVIRNVKERGPLRVITEVSPAAPRLSDEPVFTLTFEYEDGVVLTKPPFGNALGDFEILSFREPPAASLPKADGGRQIEKQIYRLEPMGAGDLKISPIKIAFRDARPQIGDGQQHSIETDEIVVPVSTMLASDAPSLTDLRPAAPPVQMPATMNYKWLGLVFGAILLLAISVWWFRRRPSETMEPIFSPREIAEAALRELERSNLAESDTKNFYVELTGIVRRYLEQTTGVRAPEQTTEEFLRDITDHHSFQVEQRDRLQQFLQSADLVKFAGHEPLPDDIEKALQRARQFIQTRWSTASPEVAA